MKANVLYIGIAALALASCNNNELRTDIVQEETPIGFQAYAGKATRNAGEMTSTGEHTGTLYTDGNTMEVWGWKTFESANTQVFDNTVCTWTSGSTQTTTKWVYSPLRFWDYAASYWFTAAAPSAEFTLVEDNADAAKRKFSANTIPAVQVLSDMNGNSAVAAATTTAIDYLVANKVEIAVSDNHGNAVDKDVEFTFNHILSKLDVKVKTTEAFDNIKGVGTYPYIDVTSIKLNLQGMRPTYSQKTAGEVDPSNSETLDDTECDTWTDTASPATDYTCLKVESPVTAVKLTKEPQLVASYFVAPTATAVAPATDAATFTGETAYKATIEYDVYHGPNAADKEHFVRKDIKLDEKINRFVQNNYYTLTLIVDPQVIYFDVKTINDWTNVAEKEVTVQ